MLVGLKLSATFTSQTISNRELWNVALPFDFCYVNNIPRISKFLYQVHSTKIVRGMFYALYFIMATPSRASITKVQNIAHTCQVFFQFFFTIFDKKVFA